MRQKYGKGVNLLIKRAHKCGTSKVFEWRSFKHYLLFNFIFLGEKLGYFEYAAILFSMLGVVIMTNPTAVFYWIEQEDAYGYDRSDYPYFNFGVVMALSASIASGTAYLMMRINRFLSMNKKM